VLDQGLGGASDEEVSAAAVASGRIIISADSDFATMLALSQGTAPSLVLLRSSDHLSPRTQADLLLANLPGLADDLAEGAVVSLGTTRARARRLPLR
jgi:predicted nuclease of predicted toxin-antitoxin system